MGSAEYVKTFKNTGIQILFEENNFLKIKETLSRIGVASNKTKTLYQSCHILHKKGLYGILHFKELFVLDNKINTLNITDIQRRDCIVKLLVDWELCQLIDSNQHLTNNEEVLKQVKILPFNVKNEWNLVQKYTIGKK